MSKQIFAETIKVKVPSGTNKKLDAAAALLSPYAPEDIRDRSSVVRLALDFLFRCLPPIENPQHAASTPNKPCGKVSKLTHTSQNNSATS